MSVTLALASQLRRLRSSLRAGIAVVAQTMASSQLVRVAEYAAT